MNIVTADTKTTLLLNGAWQVIGSICAREAFSHIFSGVAVALDKNHNVFSKINDWKSHAEFHEDQPWMRSAKEAWPIPTIIVVTKKFFKRPVKRKLSLSETARIYNYTCQYCFKKFDMKILTIDHIVPKSKGGTDWNSNRILACRSCNLKKSSHFPWYDAKGQIPKPLDIPRIILPQQKFREEWRPFLES